MALRDVTFRSSRRDRTPLADHNATATPPKTHRRLAVDDLRKDPAVAEVQRQRAEVEEVRERVAQFLNCAAQRHCRHFVHDLGGCTFLVGTTPMLMRIAKSPGDARGFLEASKDRGATWVPLKEILEC